MMGIIITTGNLNALLNYIHCIIKRITLQSTLLYNSRNPRRMFLANESSQQSQNLTRPQIKRENRAQPLHVIRDVSHGLLNRHI